MKFGMKRLQQAHLRLLQALVLSLLFAIGHAATANVLVGLVVGIHDGDTITVLDDEKMQHKVRLTGIDAPESAQPFGRRSQQALASRLFRRRVTVDWRKRDRYKRILGKVVLDGNDVNLEQVTNGFAWHYAHYAREQPSIDRTKYAAAQACAKELRRGLWQDPHPIAPWDWRHAKQSARRRR